MYLTDVFCFAGMVYFGVIHHRAGNVFFSVWIVI
jgi:hypothetical protein